MRFINLSNEEKFALANEAAIRLEQESGQKLSPEEYQKFLWDFIKALYTPKYE